MLQDEIVPSYLKLSNTRTVPIICLSFVSTMIISVPAAAKLNKENESAIEVIEVTATRRSQDSQTVGIALTALSDDMLEQLAIGNNEDISQQIPNLQLNTWSPNLTILNLRGVSQNNFTDNLEAPIAVYVDDAYIASLNAISGQLFDMKRVEVLRGPQGTLFGRNAIGGVIHYVSNTAIQDEFNGYVKSGFSSFSRRFLEGAAGGVLSDNTRIRLAFRKEKADGYIKSDSADIRAIGGANGTAFRVNVQSDLSDKLSLDLTYSHTKDDDVPTGGYAFLPWTQANIEAGYLPPELINFTQNVILEGEQPPNNLSLEEFTQAVFFNQDDGFTPVDEAGLTIYKGDSKTPHKHYSNINGYLNRDIDNVSAKLQLDLDNGMRLNSISNLQTLDKNYLEDGDGIAAPLISFNTQLDYQQWSQELRLSAESDNIRWQLGGYWLDMVHDGSITTVGNPVIRLANGLISDGLIDDDYDPSVGSPQAVQEYKIDARNWSVFGHIEYDIDDSFTLVTGLRWSDDNKRLKYRRGFKDDEANIQFIEQAKTEPNSDVSRISYDDYAARFQLNWQYNDNNLSYLSYSRGIKVGNWAFSAGVPISDLKHEPETLHAYELGLKSYAPASKLRSNASLFYYDYQDYQAFSMSGLAPQINNTDATAYGGELELSWHPLTALNVQLGFTWMNSEVEDVSAVGEWQSPVGGTLIDFPRDSIKGTELPNSPKYSINYLFAYWWHLDANTLSAQLDGVYYDEQYLEVTNGGGSFQDAYGVVNASLNFSCFDDDLSVMLWAKNVADEVYKQYNLDLGMLGSTAYYAPPRSYGMSLRYQW